MTVAELIKELQQMPQDKQVVHIWDGEPRTAIDFVWFAKAKDTVITCGCGETVYDLEARPDWADNSNFWNTPDEPKNKL